MGAVRPQEILTGIGGRLFASSSTVASHMHSLLAKTGMDNRAETTAYALRHAVVEP